MILGPGRVDKATTDTAEALDAAAAAKGAAIQESTIQGEALQEATLEGKTLGPPAVETSDVDSIPAELAAKLRFDSNGLICAVIQDADSEAVLMVAWMNQTALARTLTTGRVWFWSRSRQEYWRKGDTSGHRQYVKSVHADCDGDTLLVRVEQLGAACHTGTRTCFEAGGEIPAEVGSAAPDLACALVAAATEAAIGATETHQAAGGVEGPAGDDVASSEGGTPAAGSGKRVEGAGARVWGAVRGLLSGEGVAWILGAWVLTRLLLFFGAASVASENGSQLLDVVKQWDVHHFIEIAEVGYPNVDPNHIAFFPGLPVSMWLLGKLGVSATVAGLLIANLSALFAALALGRLSGRWAALAWLVAPAGIFAFVGYTEGPFTAAFFWAWERARRGKWGGAAALASLAAVFRVSGVFVIAALVVIALLEAKNWVERRRALAWLTVPVLAAGVYHLYVWWLTSDPMGWSHAQAAGWPRSFHWPWETLNTTWASTNAEASPFFYLLFRYEFAAALFTAPFLVYLLIRKRWPELVFMTLNFAAFSFSDFYLSYARSMLYWLPLWLLIGELLGDKPQAAAQLELQVQSQAQWLRWVRLVVGVAYLGVSAWAMAFWANLFFTGQWAG